MFLLLGPPGHAGRVADMLRRTAAHAAQLARLDAATEARDGKERAIFEKLEQLRGEFIKLAKILDDFYRDRAVEAEAALRRLPRDHQT